MPRCARGCSKMVKESEVKKEKNDVAIMVSTYDEAHQFGEVFDADLEAVFNYVASCQEISDHDWAVNNHLINDDENPTVFTVVILP